MDENSSLIPSPKCWDQDSLTYQSFALQVEVDSSEEGRITGANKQLLDQRVHEMLSEDVEAPPPPYSPPEIKTTALSPNSLSGARLCLVK